MKKKGYPKMMFTSVPSSQYFVLTELAHDGKSSFYQFELFTDISSEVAVTYENQDDSRVNLIIGGTFFLKNI
jgi:hypothetical protein